MSETEKPPHPLAGVFTAPQAPRTAPQGTSGGPPRPRVERQRLDPFAYALQQGLVKPRPNRRLIPIGNRWLAP